ETSLGVDLFVRLGSRIRLTEAGERRAAYAARCGGLGGGGRGTPLGGPGPPGRPSPALRTWRRVVRR
ncbi:hypothetical protein ACFWWN_11930, partial [Streptomyces sp. NPDC059082]